MRSGLLSFFSALGSFGRQLAALPRPKSLPFVGVVRSMDGPTFKADLIAGFVDFFEDRDRSERDRVWGATLPYDTTQQLDVVAQFDQHMDVLYQGLKEASVARMTLHRGEQLPRAC